MESLFEDYIIKLFNSDDELVGKIIAIGFPDEEQIKAAIKLHQSDDVKKNAVYATIDKRFVVDKLPFSEE
jgi:hypothetical protein